MAAPGLLKNPKFLRYHRGLGVAVPQAWGHLECLWMITHENGNARIGSPDDVEMFAQWEGEPGKLFAALKDAGGAGRVGFIELVPGEEGVWQIHDYNDHLPNWVKDRLRKREERLRKNNVPDASGTFPDAGGNVLPASDTRPDQTRPINVAAQRATSLPTPAPFAQGDAPPLFGGAAVNVRSASGPDHTANHPQLVAHWTGQWRAKHGEKCPFNDAKDGSLIAKLLKLASGDLEKSKRTVDRYLASQDPYFADKNHPLGLLISSISTFIVEPKQNGVTNGYQPIHRRQRENSECRPEKSVQPKVSAF